MPSRLLEIFTNAVALAESEREAFLRGVCGDNEQLIGHVRELLAADAMLGDATAVSALVVPPELQDLPPGSRIDAYVLAERIGSGGMATVYRAHEPRLDRTVALKVLPNVLVDDPQFAARFEQEALVIAGLDHPHIIPLYAHGIDDGVPWMALRYLAGGDLQARLERGPLEPREGLEILRGVAAGLAYAHRRGIVHRDLKPSNILLTADGVPYLADFGVAKLLEASTALTTWSGGVIGTPSYMAPEQVRNEPLGPECDVYALAVVCFRWLCGDLPFRAESPYAQMHLHVHAPLPEAELAKLPAPIAAVLRRGLSKRPDDRYHSAFALVDALETAMRDPAAGWLDPAPAPRGAAKTPHDFAALPAPRDYLGKRASATLILSGVLAASLLTVAAWRLDVRRASKPAPPPPLPAKATLRIRADASCRLSIGGKPKLVLIAGEAIELAVEPGEHVIACESMELTNVLVSTTRTATANRVQYVPLALAAPIAAAQKASVQPIARTDYRKRWSPVDEHVARDSAANLDWTRQDNGVDIDWTGADAHCRRLALDGAGWRLPELAELASLHDPSNLAHVACGRASCQVSALFEPSSYWFWSATRSDLGDAWGLTLAGGQRALYPASNSFGARAFCVRKR